MKHYDHEEDFHARDRKQFRKQRKLVQSRDRSKPSKENESPEIQEGAVKGRVISITGEGSWVEREGHVYLCTLKGLLKKDKTFSKNIVAVGDWVHFIVTSPKEGTISHVEERSTILARTDISGKKEQLIAVNVDQILISVSIAQPPLKPSLVDRYLIAAEKGNLHPIIVINKMDLLPTATQEEKELYRQFLEGYEPLGIPILSVSSREGTGMEAMKALLQNKTSVFSGQSGVGKSSLLNACFGLELKTGDVSQKTHKGSHTTTTAELLPLPGGGYCVDTPGIRSFAIWKLTKEEVIAHFQEFRSYRCKFPDCLHLNEPDCAVKRAFEKGKISPLRFVSYHTLLEEVLSQPDVPTWS